MKITNQNMAFNRTVCLFVLGLFTSIAHGETASWAGPYAGIAAGINQFDADWKTTSLVGSGSGIVPDATNRKTLSASDLGFDGYAGFNFQASDQWIVGLEASIRQFDKSKTTTGIPGCANGCVGYTNTSGDHAAVKLGTSESARIRLGYLVQPSLMVFGMAGAAWQKVTSSATCQHSGPDPICISAAGAPFTTVENSSTKVGWTAGVGLEKKITNNWLIRAEYSYSDFGKWNSVADLSAPYSSGSTVVRYDIELHTQSMSLGVVYKF